MLLKKKTFHPPYSQCNLSLGYLCLFIIVCFIFLIKYTVAHIVFFNFLSVYLYMTVSVWSTILFIV